MTILADLQQISTALAAIPAQVTAAITSLTTLATFLNANNG